ncbi:hypothetical protein [Pelagibacterium lacus]|uniref:Transmembrane protein n=1 Tax=Pelagibacterium lacus TaxID=2282655 RepID=A0A369W2K3_9HYPH|nr:hypothetical protein [Pelagibacterium lacus]RDE07590.1 hypothetical protein DVH29_15910 [Pelagibacterium lacus]
MFVPPLLALPLVVYNLMALFGYGTAADWAAPLFTITVVSGGIWLISAADLFVALSLVLLFGEILKSTRFGNASVVDHMLSTVVFVVCLVEFLLVPYAATSAFFILMLMALIDLIAGFTVSIRAAARDVQFGSGQ